MSNMRRTSSKVGLQNLIRVTAQRSLEDEEEAKREQRRRTREKLSGGESPSWPAAPPHHTRSGEELKPSSTLVLEEDEGFSDWSHKLENRKQLHLQKQEVQEDCRARGTRASRSRWNSDPEEEKHEGEEEEEGWEPKGNSSYQEASGGNPEEKICCKPKEDKMSYSSTVFVQQDTDRTSYLVTGTMRPCGRASEAEDGDEEEVEEEEVEELCFRQQQEEMGDLHLRRVGEEVEDSQLLEEEGEQRLAEGRERRTDQENQERRPTLCQSSNEDEEPLNSYGPMSPTFKNEVDSRATADGTCMITERTESLRKSTNNIKKNLPPVAVSKIDNRLEQYTHAIQTSSREAKAGKQSMDLLVPTEPVASKKNLFEAGEAWNQNSIQVTPSKDAEGLKVGVAELINQWVNGSSDGTRNSFTSKPAGSCSGQRYRFVVMGHGKYEKVAVDDDDDNNKLSQVRTFNH